MKLNLERLYWNNTRICVEGQISVPGHFTLTPNVGNITSFWISLVAP